MATPHDEEDFANANQLVNQRQRFARRPKAAADLLGKLMARKGYAQVESQQELVAAWNEVVGDKFRQRTQVAAVRSGVLEVIVSSSAVNQQLGFEKKRLLKQLQAKWSQQIKDIRFKVGPVQTSSPNNN